MIVQLLQKKGLYMDFLKGYVINKDYKTYYEVYGKLEENTVPLIVLHGGPGGTFGSYEPLIELTNNGFTLIFYNQHGSGSSKILNKEKDLYNFETYFEELDNLVKHLNIKKYYLLGHSWGGMLALQYVIDKKPLDIKKLILFSTLPSSNLWNEESLRMIDYFPKEYRKVILLDKENKKVNKKLLKKATKLFLLMHVKDKTKVVYSYKRKRKMKFNSVAYNTMWGNSELFCKGTLINYDVASKLKEIGIPTLLISGQDDESTPAMNKIMNDEIKNSKWVLLKNSQHVGYSEEPQLVIKIITDWLNA